MTEEGKVIFDYAHTLLDMKGNIERDLKSLHEDVPMLIIGSCKSVGEYALPCSIYTFKKFYKEIDIHMQIDNSQEVIKKLCDHTINIGVVQYDPKKDNISTKTITSDELVLVGSGYNNTDIFIPPLLSYLFLYDNLVTILYKIIKIAICTITTILKSIYSGK